MVVQMLGILALGILALGILALGILGLWVFLLCVFGDFGYFMLNLTIQLTFKAKWNS